MNKKTKTILGVAAGLTVVIAAVVFVSVSPDLLSGNVSNKKVPTVINTSCTDSDNGIVYKTKGLVTQKYTLDGTPSSLTFKDQCWILGNDKAFRKATSCSGSSCYLSEMHCINDKNVNEKRIQCDKCLDATCLKIGAPSTAN